MTEIFQAILLGIIEGLTEFLPVSSTGHLIIAEEYIGFRDTTKVFTVVIQSGAILAVVWFYRHDLLKKISGLFNGDNSSKYFLTTLLVASIPAGLLGLALDKKFEEYARPEVVAVALIAGALMLWWADSFEKKRNTTSKEQNNVDKVTFKQAILAGAAQSVALIPGVSRSGAAIVGGLIGGMNRVTATAFSFYLAIPILGGAALYKLISDRHELASVSGGSLSIVIGLVTSFIVALIAISWLLKYVSTHSFRLFVYWRIVLGILVLLLLV